MISHRSGRILEHKDEKNYKCVNCEDAGVDPYGHSSHWHKCPTLLQRQEKMKKDIPYYAKNSLLLNRQKNVELCAGMFGQ